MWTLTMAAHYLKWWYLAGNAKGYTLRVCHQLSLDDQANEVLAEAITSGRLQVTEGKVKAQSLIVAFCAV